MKVLKQQHWHLVILFLLLSMLYWYTQTQVDMRVGSLWGTSSLIWIVLAILIPIIHQVYVLVCWRSELYYNSISKLMGKHGFTIYKIGFAILILLRPITITLLAISNKGTLNLNTTTAYIISVILLIPSLYLFYSVKTYFGFDRAFGIDHFYPDTYKQMPFVKQGIFKYTSNSMYVFGFFILWIPGILLKSEAAVVLALFSHIYIWVHYYFTELPDIKMIYGEVRNRKKTHH